MSVLANSNVISGDAAIDTGDIGHSLRFRSAASAYLSRAFSAPTANTVWTLSLWIKRGSTGSEQSIFAAGDSEIFFNASNQLVFKKDGSVVATSSALLRDSLGHGHLHITSENNPITAYWNGDLVLTYAGTIPDFNSAVTHYIGRDAAASGDFADFYVSRVSFFDNAGSTPYFTATLNAEINEWVTRSQSYIKSLVESKGTNSFMLDFDDGTSLTTLGYDKSSKGNNWTLNNFSLTAGATYDWMLDVPGNSYCTWSPINTASAAGLTNGNLSWAGTNQTAGTIGVSSGKYYFEITVAGNSSVIGIGLNGIYPGTSTGIENNFASYQTFNGNKRIGAGNAAYDGSGACAAGTVIAFAVDLDVGEIVVYRNNVSKGVMHSWTPSGTTYLPYCTYATTSAGVDVANFGQRPFTYTPPAGFQALCQRNLSDLGTVTVSGSFTGNANANGPSVWMNGVPNTLTINGNAVTFGTHADKLAGGFKLRTASTSYNSTGTNTWTATITSNLQNIFKYNNAEGNP